MPDVPLTARAGEMVDELLHRAFGRTGGLVEAVLAANAGLSASERLAEGQTITVPEAAQAAPTSKLFDLWD